MPLIIAYQGAVSIVFIIGVVLIILGFAFVLVFLFVNAFYRAPMSRREIKERFHDVHARIDVSESQGDKNARDIESKF